MSQRDCAGTTIHAAVSRIDRPGPSLSSWLTMEHDDTAIGSTWRSNTVDGLLHTQPRRTLGCRHAIPSRARGLSHIDDVKLLRFEQLQGTGVASPLMRATCLPLHQMSSAKLFARSQGSRPRFAVHLQQARPIKCAEAVHRHARRGFSAENARPRLLHMTGCDH